MATQLEIFTVRLRVSDPAGFIAFEEATTLPSAPANQTAYLYDGDYYATERTSGATLSDYEVQELRLSDSVIGGYIDNSGVQGAMCEAIKQLIANLGMEMRIKSLSGGADTTEYQSLSDLSSYYTDLLAICVDDKKEDAGNNTGRMFTTKAPEIAGGNL